MGPRDELMVGTRGGDLRGWVSGEGPLVLLLHGGPGLSFEYLDGLAEEIGPGFRIAAFQQRGLAPSTLAGPFTMPQAIEDVLAVADALPAGGVLVVGHSWGGHLALRLAAMHPDRLRGVVAVDPIGVVGDGGVTAFEAEMYARTPRRDRDRMQELDRRAMAGKGTAEEALESFRLVWPSYFADPAHTLLLPEPHLSVEAYSSLIQVIGVGLEEVAAHLAEGVVPYHVIAGAGSPIPWGQAAQASAELSPLGELTVVAGAGHMPWFEAPGCVRAVVKHLST